MICLDSDCIIDFLKGKPNAVRAVELHCDKLCTTEINVFEVLFGIYLKKNINSEEVKAVNLLIESLDILSFGQGCGEQAAKILSLLAKQGNMVGQNDTLIAASMLVNGCNEILTGNVKHYSRINGIRVMNY